MNKYFLLLLIPFVLFSCKKTLKGEGVVLTRNYPIDQLDEVIIEGNFRIYLTQSSVNKINIESDENLLENIEVKYDDGTLKIKDTQDVEHFEKHDIILDYKMLKKLYIGGESKTILKGKTILDDFVMDLSGNHECNILNLNVDDLSIDISGNSSLSIKEGEAKNFELEYSGNGSIDTKNFKARKLEIDGTGNMKLDVYAKKKIDVDVSGNSVVNIYGSAKNKISTSGNALVHDYSDK